MSRFVLQNKVEIREAIQTKQSRSGDMVTGIVFRNLSYEEVMKKILNSTVTSEKNYKENFIPIQNVRKVIDIMGYYSVARMSV